MLDADAVELRDEERAEDEEDEADEPEELEVPEVDETANPTAGDPF